MLLAGSEIQVNMFSTRCFGEIPNLILKASCKRTTVLGRRLYTYDLDGLKSSSLLSNGCCVGVAADTDTVDELCAVVNKSAREEQ